MKASSLVIIMTALMSATAFSQTLQAPGTEQSAVVSAPASSVNVLPNVVSGVDPRNLTQEQLQQYLSKQQVIDAFHKTVKSTQPDEAQIALFNQNVQQASPETHFSRNQFFVIADRNPKHQDAALAYWNQDTKSVELIGFTKISTGSVRSGHFFTPVGWFTNSPEFGSYRAQGTKNENGIRGYGRKGMRVWDFGWVPSTSGWKKGLNIDIRFQMHATDPDYLEQRLGRPDSKGCVRIHNTFNNFLDQYGIIDAQYEAANSWVLRKDRIQIQDAGDKLLVIDTQENTKTASK